MKLETLARKMMLTPVQAIALPMVITTAAKSVSLTDHEMIGACVSQPRVCEYLASVCRSATK
jgi:hypothetical protein